MYVTQAAYTQQWYGLILLEKLTKSRKKTTITLSTSREVIFSKMLSNCEEYHTVIVNNVKNLYIDAHLTML